MIFKRKKKKRKRNEEDIEFQRNREIVKMFKEMLKIARKEKED